MNKHRILMLIGCVLPLLLIFLLPVFGITGNIIKAQEAEIKMMNDWKAKWVK